MHKLSCSVVKPGLHSPPEPVEGGHQQVHSVFGTGPGAQEWTRRTVGVDICSGWLVATVLYSDWSLAADLSPDWWRAAVLGSDWL